MPTCTGNCASIKPAAGNGFIFRGGDTWGSSNFGINWTWAGNATNPIYIGVDKNWFSGSSWARPIWNLQMLPNFNGPVFNGSVPYWIADNIEITGVFFCSACGTSGTGAYVFQACTNHATVENSYYHGWGWTTPWTRAGGPFDAGFIQIGCGVSSYAGDTARYNVVDGSDTANPQVALVTFAGNIPIAYGNYMNYVWSGLDGCGDDWYNNVVNNMGIPVNAFYNSGGSYHQNAFKHLGPCSNSVIFFYNNVVSNQINWGGGGGAVKYWINGIPGSYTTYAFNNVVTNVVPGNVIDDADQSHCTNCSSGTYYFFNNTIQCGNNSSMGACSLGMTTGGTINAYLSDNHWIQSGTGSPLSCTNNPGGTCTETNDVLQTLAQANAQGYTDASSYAFQPTSTSGSTVTAAANAAARQSLCTTIGAVDAGVGTACQSDTTYACSYDTTSHTVRCPTRETVARTAEPNIGAYQFSSAQASIPNPPAGLTVSVQ
ncbi:MAG: hypothetical protein WBQ89_09515 [Candidatus Acidiferrum sp.]